jgi:hypothetical protein
LITVPAATTTWLTLLPVRRIWQAGAVKTRPLNLPPMAITFAKISHTAGMDRFQAVAMQRVDDQLQTHTNGEKLPMAEFVMPKDE